MLKRNSSFDNYQHSNNSDAVPECTSNTMFLKNLRPVQEIPHRYQQIFAEYPSFNFVQSAVFDDLLYTDESLVVSAPTGSGKTGIFELALIRALIAFENTKFANAFKAVYISPLKALAEERLVDWHKKFNPFGMNCISITGDSENIEFRELLNHNLIITTPEKWDCLTRKWRDNKKLVQQVKLFMIDEVHLLNEDSRGSVLETIVCRMKTIQDALGDEAAASFDMISTKIRFIAVSATIPNIEDVAEWIGKLPDVKYFKFSDKTRPVQLKKIVLDYPHNPKQSFFKFDLSLNYKLISLIRQYSEGKPTLIFCSTRKIVEMTANHILQHFTINQNAEQKQRLMEISQSLSDSKVKSYLTHGVAYHHGGMLATTRHAVENLFKNGDLPILVTTSTLAMGVNLPAHLVIIKSTKFYTNNGFQDYTETAILQMMGRAGRPQYDNSATVLILTTKKDKEKFEKMLGGTNPIESNLHKHLTEHLNAEVVLQTITDLDVALRWLSSTFLYIRARKNPKYYGLGVELSVEQIDKKLMEICQIDLNKLTKAKMLTIDPDVVLRPTLTGILMAKYYLDFETVKLFTQLNGEEILLQILNMISKCHEFSEMYLRVNDKRCLNVLNKCKNRQTIRFPLSGRIKTIDMKINCLIQAVLGCLDICDHSLLTETIKIMRNGERIVKCLIEYLQSKSKCYKALLSSITLAKCFNAKLWENSPYVSKQLAGIGTVMSTQLVNAGKTSFDQILNADPREIELIINKKPPMGNTIQEQIKYLPKYNILLEQMQDTNFRLVISLENAADLRKKSTASLGSLMYLLVGDSSNNILLYEKHTHSYMIEHPEIVKNIEIKVHDFTTIEANFISDDWVGIDCISKFESPDRAQPNQNSVMNKSNNKVKQRPTTSPTYMQTFINEYMKHKKSLNSSMSNTKNPENDIEHNKIVTKNCESTSEKCEDLAQNEVNINHPIENCDSEDHVSVDDATAEYSIGKNINAEQTTKRSTNNKTQSKLNDSHSQTGCSKHADLYLQADRNSDQEKTHTLRDKKYGNYRTLPNYSPLSNDNVASNTIKNLDRNVNNIKAVLQKFNYKPHKKLSVESNSAQDESLNRRVSSNSQTTTTFSDNVDKNTRISWRSPLVYSPPTKYSPKLPKLSPQDCHQVALGFQQYQTSSQGTMSESTSTLVTAREQSPRFSRKCTMFPLADKDNDGLSNKPQPSSSSQLTSGLEDVIASSFIEMVGVSRKINTKTDNKIDNTTEMHKIPSATDYYSQLMSRPEPQKLQNSPTATKKSSGSDQNSDWSELCYSGSTSSLVARSRISSDDRKSNYYHPYSQRGSSQHRNMRDLNVFSGNESQFNPVGSDSHMGGGDRETRGDPFLIDRDQSCYKERCEPNNGDDNLSRTSREAIVDYSLGHPRNEPHYYSPPKRVQSSAVPRDDPRQYMVKIDTRPRFRPEHRSTYNISASQIRLDDPFEYPPHIDDYRSVESRMGNLERPSRQFDNPRNFNGMYRRPERMPVGYDYLMGVMNECETIDDTYLEPPFSTHRAYTDQMNYMEHVRPKKYLEETPQRRFIRNIPSPAYEHDYTYSKPNLSSPPQFPLSDVTNLPSPNYERDFIYNKPILSPPLQDTLGPSNDRNIPSPTYERNFRHNKYNLSPPRHFMHNSQSPSATDYKENMPAEYCNFNRDDYGYPTTPPSVRLGRVGDVPGGYNCHKRRRLNLDLSASMRHDIHGTSTMKKYLMNKFLQDIDQN